MSPSERLLISAHIPSYVVALSSSQVRSTTDTSIVGTRKAMPVSLPFTSGTTLATALAAPVEEGIMFPDAAPILLGSPIHGGLRRGHGVDRGHQTPLDTESI